MLTFLVALGSTDVAHVNPDPVQVEPEDVIEGRLFRRDLWSNEQSHRPFVFLFYC